MLSLPYNVAQLGVLVQQFLYLRLLYLALCGIISYRANEDDIRICQHTSDDRSQRLCQCIIFLGATNRRNVDFLLHFKVSNVSLGRSLLLPRLGVSND